MDMMSLKEQASILRSRINENAAWGGRPELQARLDIINKRIEEASTMITVDTHTTQEEASTMDYIDTMTDPEAIEQEFVSLLLDNERDWLLLDWGTLDTVIKCQKCGFDHVCADRESAMFLIQSSCDMCEYA